MAFQESISKHLHQDRRHQYSAHAGKPPRPLARSPSPLCVPDDYLADAKESFVRDAVYMGQRQDFEDYMRVLENQFYETVKLPKSPY